MCKIFILLLVFFVLQACILNHSARDDIIFPAKLILVNESSERIFIESIVSLGQSEDSGFIYNKKAYLKANLMLVEPFMESNFQSFSKGEFVILIKCGKEETGLDGAKLDNVVDEESMTVQVFLDQESICNHAEK